MDVKEMQRIMAKAKCPEDVFGELKNTTLKDVYRLLAKALHPDRNPTEAVAATAAFAELTAWYDRAQAKAAAGTYGDRDALDKVTITSKRGAYRVKSTLAAGDLSDLYLADDPDGLPSVVKVVRNPRNGDLMNNEHAILTYMHDAWNGKGLEIMQHVPHVIDSFKIKQGAVARPALVMPYKPGITLEYAGDAFAASALYIDPRDLAWMINRMLSALLACHQAGYVHGAVLPPHIYLHPDTHGGQLLDWSYAVKNGEMLKAIPMAWRSYYPPEVVRPDKPKRQPATFGTDLYMLAKSIWSVTDCGATLPKQYAGLFRACLLGPGHRSDDVFELFKELQDVLSALYGPKKFREFKLPTTPKT